MASWKTLARFALALAVGLVLGLSARPLRDRVRRAIHHNPAAAASFAGRSTQRMSLATTIQALPGLTAYYKCDDASGNLADSSGNSKTLTATGTITYGVAGQSGNAVTFDGSTGYASRGDSVLGTTLPSEWTIGLLVKGSAQDAKWFCGCGSSTNTNPIVAVGSGATSIPQSTSAIRPFVRDDASTIPWGNSTGQAYGTALDAQWHLIVARRKSGVYQLFIDGTSAGSVTVAQSTLTLSTTAIGALLRSTAANFSAATAQHVFFCNQGIADADVTSVYNAAFAGATTATIAVNDSHLIYSPYNWVASGSNYAETNAPGAYLKTKFTGTSLGVTLSSPSFTGTSLRLTAVVDNTLVYNTAVAAAATSATLASGLASGTHDLQLFYGANDPTQDVWTTPTIAAKITGLTVDSGATAATPTTRSRRMLWLGDSVSYGISALRSTTSPTGNDATLAPGFAVAQALDAEIGILGYGSQGYGKTGLGNAPRVYDPSSPSTSGWLNYWSGQSRLSGGLLSPAPDYVVCYHGTADYTGSASDANVTAGVQGLLPALRTAAPSAKIFCVVPANRQKLTAITAGFDAAFTSHVLVGTVGPVTVYRGQTDASAFLIDLGTELSGGVSGPSGGPATWQAIDSIHPDGPTNGRIAAAITAGLELAIGGGGGGKSGLLNGGGL